MLQVRGSRRLGVAQLEAVFNHGYAYARSMPFYRQMLLWQWLRTPGDVVFAAGAVLMALDFVVKSWRYFRAERERAGTSALSGGAAAGV